MSRPPVPAPSLPRPGRRRAVKVALVLSLALNLLLAGVLAGALLHRLQGPRAAHPERVLRGLGYQPYIAALPEAARRDLARAAAERAGSLRLNREELRAQLAEILALLRAESFDAERLAALLGAQGARLDERQRLGAELLLAELARMTPAERRAYADSLQDGFRARPSARARSR